MSVLKRARGDFQDNYRLISLTLLPSRIITEGLRGESVYTGLDQRNMINDFQHSFMENQSCRQTNFLSPTKITGFVNKGGQGHNRLL